MVVWVACKNCDPVNTCHSVVLRDCLGRKNALYKYLILYFILDTVITNIILDQFLKLGVHCCQSQMDHAADGCIIP